MAAIHDSIIDIMKHLDSLPKDGTNPEGWKFRSVETLIRKLQPLFIEHNIVCTCEIRGLTREQPNREIKSRSVVSLRYTLTSAKDGSSITTDCIGEGECLFDKATPKAMTGAWKQMFFQLFMIPVSEDDPDAQSVPAKSASAQMVAAKPTNQAAKANDPQKPVRPDNTPKPEVSIDPKKVAAYQGAIDRFLAMYESHDDDYHEVTVKDGKSEEHKESLIQRVDNLRAAILAMPDHPAKTRLLENFDKLIAKTSRADAKRKEIVSKISELNPGSSKQQIAELNSWIEKEFGGKMIPTTSRDQLKASIKGVTGT